MKNRGFSIRAGLLCCLLGWCGAACGEHWSVTPRGSLVLEDDSILELSGVTYMGPAGAGLHRFLAVQDSGNQLVAFDVGVNPNGELSSASVVSQTFLSPGFDFEGIVYNGPGRNTVYLSEEDTPSVREYSLATGMQTASLTIPTVFTNRRPNFGFESLTKDATSGTIWTANEEALTIDGPLSTTTTGTYVRLQQFVENGGGAAAAAQFAYHVDPIHTGVIVNSNTRSGLVDLAVMPDGTMLALERSSAVGAPVFQSRIYQIDFTGATDISASQFNAGLVGQTFTTVGKTLLWSGPIGGTLGKNLEGLTLGPQLANGNWLTLGVVDSGDGLSATNTIVAFELYPPPCGPIGDYDCSGGVNASDYSTWTSIFGAAGQSPADGNRDGFVDAADYAIWRDHLSTASGSSVATVPEPGMIVWTISAFIAMWLWRNKKAAALK